MIGKSVYQNFRKVAYLAIQILELSFCPGKPSWAHVHLEQQIWVQCVQSRQLRSFWQSNAPVQKWRDKEKAYF